MLLQEQHGANKRVYGLAPLTARRPWRHHRRGAPPSIFITRCLFPRHGSGAPAATSVGKNPFLVHVEVQSVLQIDVEEPEMSENPNQSFEIHYIFRRRTQLLAVIIYSI